MSSAGGCQKNLEAINQPHLFSEMNKYTCEFWFIPMPKEILPKLAIFHFKIQVFPFRRIDLIPLRGASHNKDKLVFKIT